MKYIAITKYNQFDLGYLSFAKIEGMEKALGLDPCALFGHPLPKGSTVRASLIYEYGVILPGDCVETADEYFIKEEVMIENSEWPTFHGPFSPPEIRARLLAEEAQERIADTVVVRSEDELKGFSSND